MQSYQHFTLEERENLRLKLCEGKSLRSIAKEMKRNASSISRELMRNRNKDGTYNAWRGCTLYIIRRKNSKRKYRIEKDTELKTWIDGCLAKYWPPETIVATWKLKNMDNRLSHCTIYAALKAGRLEGFSLKSHLRRHGKKKYTRSSRAVHPEHSIKDRPDIINCRERVGDWEGDTVYSSVGNSCLVTCVDRKSRYLVASLLSNRLSELTNEAIQKTLHGLPVHSITLDNGSEFAGHKALEESLDTTVFFADPYSPWQRGTNENTNGLLRFFFPKGTNFNSVSQKTLDYVVGLLNDRPRKCLGWLSPAQVLSSACCT